MIHLNDEQLAQIKKIKDAIKRGYYVRSTDVTPLYNKVFNKNLNNTNCASCLKMRSHELVKVYDEYVAYIIAEEERKKAEIAENNIPVEEPTETKKAGRPKKRKE